MGASVWVEPPYHHPRLIPPYPPSPSSKSKVRPYLEFLTTSFWALGIYRGALQCCNTFRTRNLKVNDDDYDNDDDDGSWIRSQLKYHFSPPRAIWSLAAQIHHRHRLHQYFWRHTVSSHIQSLEISLRIGLNLSEVINWCVSIAQRWDQNLQSRPQKLALCQLWHALQILKGRKGWTIILFIA